MEVRVEGAWAGECRGAVGRPLRRTLRPSRSRGPKLRVQYVLCIQYLYLDRSGGATLRGMNVITIISQGESVAQGSGVGVGAYVEISAVRREIQKAIEEPFLIIELLS